ncbi:magnesium/cobalt transporter CorA [Telmatocola sphagniphila]|uniref:Magnesium transport protein CorA n=1 Tax=Telmatocola sphagniphila TaxID=1123043 RepID=A0A8E6EZ42_9BACT|nr:magnesium/cobalt transporter CorA [Telmatocola sphagniphila]QVL33041.1 magnesium/cobalt transporter CorA [Telmatocola sphagniphila]
MLQVYRWDKDSKKCCLLDAEQVKNLSLDPQLSKSDYWIDLESPTPEEEAWIFEKVRPVHALVLEDIRKPIREPEVGPHLPKVEEWDDYLFAIVNPLNREYLNQCGDEIQPTERHRAYLQFSAVLTSNALITHHYTKLSCVDHLKNRLSHEVAIGNRGPDYLYHWLLDDLVDECAPVIDEILESLDDLEREILEQPQPSLLRKLLRHKSFIVILRKTMILEREVLARLTRNEFELVSPQEVIYYRNVYDHLIRYTEMIEGAREMISDLMQTHLAAVSNKLNTIMKVLTMISTIILPMTLIASIYGMNFDVLPGKEHPGGFWLSILAMGGCGIISLIFFRWRRWL